MVVSATANGLFRGRHFGTHRYCRHVLRQGIPWALSRVSCCSLFLGRTALGAKDAAWPSGRFGLALEGTPCVFRCHSDRRKPHHYVRSHYTHRGDAADPKFGCVVRVEQSARTSRLRCSGHSSGRNDGGGSTDRRSRRSAAARGADQGPSHDHADVGPNRADWWAGIRSSAEHFYVLRGRETRTKRDGPRVRPDLLDGAGHPASVDQRRGAVPSHACRPGTTSSRAGR